MQVNKQDVQLLDDIPADLRIDRLSQYYFDEKLQPRNLLKALPESATGATQATTPYGRLQNYCQSGANKDAPLKPFFNERKIDDFCQEWERAIGGNQKEEVVLGQLRSLLQMWVSADSENHTRCALFEALLRVDFPVISILQHTSTTGLVNDLFSSKLEIE